MSDNEKARIRSALASISIVTGKARNWDWGPIPWQCPLCSEIGLDDKNDIDHRKECAVSILRGLLK